MIRKALLRSALLATAIVVAGCQDTLDSVGKADRPLPTEIINTMKAKGMTRSSPILVRIFKEEGVLEVWKQKDTGRFDIVKTYEICKWSGKLGPKFTEGDRQAPEGFYTVSPGQMNPQSLYYLSFNIGYPNAYDRANGRTGQHLMVHGACSSAGCYSMTDEQVAEIYAFGRDSFRGGQRDFQVQAFPFRMTAQNMARYRDDPNYEFWKMLKEGYDYFEITKFPPKVDVCEKRYVFNKMPDDGHNFSPAGLCPPMSQPDTLATAYVDYQQQFTQAFEMAISKSAYPPPKASISGLKEARLVADWSKRRARGEKVAPEPPSLTTAVSAAPQPKPVETAVQPVATSAETPGPAALGDAEIAPIPVPSENPQNADAAEKPDEKRGWRSWLNPFGG